MEFTQALIDADILVYRIGYMSEDDDENLALWSLDEYIRENITNKIKADYLYFLTGIGNFRFDVAKSHPYKGNRKQAKPKHYGALRQHLIEKYNAEVVHGEEADDKIGILQNENTVIVSIDKDLNNIPGWHYNFTNDNLYYVDSVSATRNFFQQMLTGDNVDNIKCINGIGKVKAGKLLNHLTSYEEMLCTVGLQYAIHEEYPEERMLENGKLLWIRQHQNEMWRID